ncbi:DUF6339 family protein [uncultured Veillonella sp.]|uniref:DUF6339 family protein n=1 Tax=uncultured Veillonella sp. TaxID=159268 RepID=UPI002613407B|nr:DUF6339 family protein [uncultured Veillonella sp.]
MAEDTFYTIKDNIAHLKDNFIKYPEDSSWIETLTNNSTYNKKPFKMIDFELKVPKDFNDRKAEMENSKILYEALKDVPPFILANKLFWAWLLFDKCYKVALIMMQSKKATTFNNQWLGADTDRRGLFFGILSRMYYRVALTIDESLSNKYELTDYILENPLRYREISWRNIASCRHIVRGFVRGIKTVNETYTFREKGSYYAVLAKDLSRFGSVKLLDIVEENDIKSHIILCYIKLLKEKKF